MTARPPTTTPPTMAPVRSALSAAGLGVAAVEDGAVEGEVVAMVGVGPRGRWKEWNWTKAESDGKRVGNAKLALGSKD